MFHLKQLIELWQFLSVMIHCSAAGSVDLEDTSLQTVARGHLYGYYYHNSVAIGGFLGLVLIKITVLVVVLATLITGGLLIKLFGLGLVFSASRFPFYNHGFNYNPVPYNHNEYRAIIQPRLDIIKTIFNVMMVDSKICKSALVCSLDKEAVQSPLLKSAFDFIMTNFWKVELDEIQDEDCTDLFLKCNNL